MEYCKYLLFDLKLLDRWLDKIKCEKFLKDSNEHFIEKKIVNSDTIYKFIRGEKTPADDLKKYQTIQNSRVKQYPQKDKDKFLSPAFRTDRKDLYFEKQAVNSHFKSLSKK